MTVFSLLNLLCLKAFVEQSAPTSGANHLSNRIGIKVNRTNRSASVNTDPSRQSVLGAVPAPAEASSMTAAMPPTSRSMPSESVASNALRLRLSLP